MMDKIKVLEVNNIDLPGRRFNGYNMIKEISDNNEVSSKSLSLQKEEHNIKDNKNTNEKDEVDKELENVLNSSEEEKEEEYSDFENN